MAISDGIIAALVGAGAAVGLVFLARRSNAQPEPDKDAGSGGGVSPCDLLKSNPSAYASCLALQGGIEVIGGIVDMLPDGPGDEYRDKDLKNRQLNGKVKTPLEQYMRSCLDTSYGHIQSNGTWYVPLWGTALEFENGCTPFKGSPGWSKCAPGTASMMIGESYINKNADNYDPVTRTVNWEMHGPPAHVMTGDRYRDGDKLIVDAATGRYSAAAAGGNCGAKTPFPLPIPEGGAGWVFKGRPFVTPAGAWPDFEVLDENGMPTIRGLGGIRDNRTDAAEWLDNHMGGTRDQLGGVIVNHTGRIDDPCVTDPAHFVMDTAADGTPFCRRKMAGEP